MFFMAPSVFAVGAVLVAICRTGATQVVAELHGGRGKVAVAGLASGFYPQYVVIVCPGFMGI